MRFSLSRVSLLLGLIIFTNTMSLLGQSSRAGGGSGSRFMERVDADEGAQRLENFRNMRLDGDFIFDFTLEHLPHRAKTQRFNGTLWGSWNAQGPINRFRIVPPDAVETGRLIELIVQGGVAPKVWRREYASNAFEPVTGEQLFEPIFKGVEYTAFDLLMPFVYWAEYSYVGPERMRSRVAQRFEMLPPENSEYVEQGIGSVRIGLDDSYDTLLFVEVLDNRGEVLSDFQVGRWKKVDGRYIVKEIVLGDTRTKNRTRFIVDEAEVGLNLDHQKYFSPVPEEVHGPMPLSGPSTN